MMPQSYTWLRLPPVMSCRSIPPIITHFHGHRDDRARVSQFSGLPSVQVVPADPADVQALFGFDAWPGSGSVDLGDRKVRVVAAPGHHPGQLVFHDDRTGLVFTGDYLLPGRLLVDDAAAYRASTQRVIDFLGDRTVTHVLGGHVEMNVDGELYPHGSQHHPNERRLQMTRADLLAMPAALADFNGFHGRYEQFVTTNPTHMLGV